MKIQLDHRFLLLMLSTIIAGLLLGAVLVFIPVTLASNAINVPDSQLVLPLPKQMAIQQSWKDGPADTYELVLTEAPTDTVTIDLTTDNEIAG